MSTSERNFYYRSELSNALGITIGTLKNWERSGCKGRRLPAGKLGSKTIYHKADVDIFLKAVGFGGHGLKIDDKAIITPTGLAKRADAAQRRLAVKHGISCENGPVHISAVMASILEKYGIDAETGKEAANG